MRLKVTLLQRRKVRIDLRSEIRGHLFNTAA